MFIPKESIGPARYNVKNIIKILKDTLDWANFDKTLDLYPEITDLDEDGNYIDPLDHDPERFWQDTNLHNPYSVASCVILYLYSMELGCPPLYKVLNLAMRMCDLSYLKTLGPFAMALFSVS